MESGRRCFGRLFRLGLQLKSTRGLQPSHTMARICSALLGSTSIAATLSRTFRQSDSISTQVLHLEKLVHTWWACAFKGHPCIDTQRVDSTRHIRQPPPPPFQLHPTPTAAPNLFPPLNFSFSSPAAAPTTTKLKSAQPPSRLALHARLTSIRHSSGCNSQGCRRPAAAAGSSAPRFRLLSALAVLPHAALPQVSGAAAAAGSYACVAQKLREESMRDFNILD